MTNAENTASAEMLDRIEELTGNRPRAKVPIVSNTTAQMNIYRGQVVRLEGHDFYMLGDVFEPRFGLDDQPKYWVKKTIDMETGRLTILKLAFFEEFYSNVGPIRMRCFRSPEKESRVLELVRGDHRFMQGYTVRDQVGNEVRVIDYIHGRKIFDLILDLQTTYEEYFHTMLEELLRKLIPCIKAVAHLHDHDLCHGDIRNDHIIIDADTGVYRWIDFDLSQHYTDFDVWSIGNILQFVVGMGTASFANIQKSDEFSDRIKKSLSKNDASAFYVYRIMNLRKVYEYIPKKLNDILMHFCLGATVFYETITQITDDLSEAVELLPKAEEGALEQ